MTEQVFKITAADVKELTKLIKDHAKVDKGPKDEFCKIWPQVKVGLQALQGIIGGIPGVGWLKIVIGMVITTGDAAAAALCH